VCLVRHGEGIRWPFPDAAEACPEFLRYGRRNRMT
jgi:hypothetical protein